MGNSISDSRCSRCKGCPRCGDGEEWRTCTCRCRKKVTCTCKCNVGTGHDIAQKASAITAGTLLGAGGIALTVLTGGVAIPIVGGMLAGAGISSAIHGTVKAITKKKISGKEYGVDVTVGFVTGVIGGGGVAATESVATVAAGKVVNEACKRGATKLGIRVAGGVISSVASTAVEEAGNCAKGRKKWKDYGKDPKIWGKGVAIGAAGGIASHTISNIKKVASPAQKLASNTASGNGGSKFAGSTDQGSTPSNNNINGSQNQSGNKSGEFFAKVTKETIKAAWAVNQAVREDFEESAIRSETEMRLQHNRSRHESSAYLAQRRRFRSRELA
ncbi:NEDD4-binding protein 2 [Branchiostoma belcheri]|nr:NEDD4-binding protein 2 [Branchiostoma belcheri]